MYISQSLLEFRTRRAVKTPPPPPPESTAAFVRRQMRPPPRVPAKPPRKSRKPAPRGKAPFPASTAPYARREDLSHKELGDHVNTVAAGSDHPNKRAGKKTKAAHLANYQQSYDALHHHFRHHIYNTAKRFHNVGKLSPEQEEAAKSHANFLLPKVTRDYKKNILDKDKGQSNALFGAYLKRATKFHLIDRAREAKTRKTGGKGIARWAGNQPTAGPATRRKSVAIRHRPRGGEVKPASTSYDVSDQGSQARGVERRDTHQALRARTAHHISKLTKPSHRRYAQAWVDHHLSGSGTAFPKSAMSARHGLKSDEAGNLGQRFKKALSNDETLKSLAASDQAVADLMEQMMSYPLYRSSMLLALTESSQPKSSQRSRTIAVMGLHENQYVPRTMMVLDEGAAAWLAKKARGVKQAGRAAWSGLKKGGAVGAVSGKKKGQTIGKWTGAGIGGTVGGALGTAAAPGVGTAIGGATGGAIGHQAGKGIGGKIGKTLGAIKGGIKGAFSGAGRGFKAGQAKETRRQQRQGEPSFRKMVGGAIKKGGERVAGAPAAAARGAGVAAGHVQKAAQAGASEFEKGRKSVTQPGRRTAAAMPGNTGGRDMSSAAVRQRTRTGTSASDPSLPTPTTVPKKQPQAAPKPVAAVPKKTVPSPEKRYMGPAAAQQKLAQARAAKAPAASATVAPSSSRKSTRPPISPEGRAKREAWLKKREAAGKGQGIAARHVRRSLGIKEAPPASAAAKAPAAVPSWAAKRKPKIAQRAAPPPTAKRAAPPSRTQVAMGKTGLKATFKPPVAGPKRIARAGGNEAGTRGENPIVKAARHRAMRGRDFGKVTAAIPGTSHADRAGSRGGQVGSTATGERGGVARMKARVQAKLGGATKVGKAASAIRDRRDAASVVSHAKGMVKKFPMEQPPVSVPNIGGKRRDQERIPASPQQRAQAAGGTSPAQTGQRTTQAMQKTVRSSPTAAASGMAQRTDPAQAPKAMSKKQSDLLATLRRRGTRAVASDKNIPLALLVQEWTENQVALFG